MKILYHHRTGSRDGQSVHIDELIRALRAQGHEVVIVAPPTTEQAAFGGGAGWVAWLKRWLPKAGYELAELAYGAVALWRLRRAVLQHRPDVLYERYNLFLPAGVLLRHWYGLPMLLEVNAPLAAERNAFGGLALARFAAWVERATWRGADHVLPVTEVLAGEVRAAGVAAARITVVANGVPETLPHRSFDSAALRRRLGLEGAVVLGFTGFLREWHRLERVVELLPGHPSMHLLVIGDGPARPQLERCARDLGVAERVHCLGVVERDLVPEHIAAFDIALQPAVVPYASPLKLFEYMALGKPVVAPDTPNIREILQHGHNALLFDPERPAAFAERVAELAADAGLRHRLGQAARDDILGRGLTWENNARTVARLAAALAEQRRAYPLRPKTLGPMH